MSSCVADLDGILQSMLLLKAPGVTGSKIASITALCNANIQSETVLIQKVYTHFKKAPGTHKLGVLYVVDSVTRQWVEQARKAGQSSGPAAPDGTFAAGVNHVTELLPSFMSDIINTAPEDQKARIRKLVDIWERGSTFPAPMLSNFKEKLNAPNANAMKSTTPDGTPPKDFISLNEQPGNFAAAPTPDTSKILQALAEMAKSNTAASGFAAQASSNNVTSSQTAFPQNMSSSVNPAPSVPPVAQAVSVPSAANGILSFAGLSNVPNFPQNLPNLPNLPNLQNGQSGPSNMQATPVMPPGNGPVTAESLQQQLQVLQALQAQGVPQEQWVTVLSVLMSSGAAQAPNPNSNFQVQAQTSWQQPGGYDGRDRDDSSRDRNGYNDQYMRSPTGRYRNRSRSRSPPSWDRRRDITPPRRRDSPVYGEYDGDPSGRNNARGSHGRQGRGKGAGNDYRQRSPAPDRFRRSQSPRRSGQEAALPPPGPKWMEYDQTLADGTIKVLSRTLFVGGVTSSEEVLRGIFSAFGLVQTCIVNVDKRHAFVKMITRTDAMAAKEGMERYKSAEMQLRTRWGVGFGPRDCSDYQTGISIIPIERLTDADRKWMLTADYGGTGGKPIESGLVVEEPDIEIGAGVSSKAISRRMATDKGGQQGPRSTRDAPSSSSSNTNATSNTNSNSASRHRQSDRSDRDANNIGVAPAVPGFGFQFPGMPNGMPMFPPGWVVPGPTPAQPPPPGAS